MNRLASLWIMIVLFLATFPITAGNAPEWISASPVDSRLRQEAHKLPETRHYEVRISKMGTAVTRLQKRSWLALDDDQARYFLGPHYRPQAGHKPYLVRGVFANSTGKHSIFWKDGQLLVRHDSLGKNATAAFCPLIVLLPEAPRQVFIELGGAL